MDRRRRDIGAPYPTGSQHNLADKTHRTALTPIVASMVAIPIELRSTGVSSPCRARSRRWKDSLNTWTNEMIMTTEKMSCGEQRRCRQRGHVLLRGARTSSCQRGTVRELSLCAQAHQMPICRYSNGPVRPYDDERRQQVKRRIDKRRNKRDRGRVQHRDDLGTDKEEVDNGVDCCQLGWAHLQSPFIASVIIRFLSASLAPTTRGVLSVAGTPASSMRSSSTGVICRKERRFQLGCGDVEREPGCDL